MNPSKPIVTISLMIASIVLLLALQVFWLRGSYEKAYFDFHREVSGVFRNIVAGMRDSIILKHLEPVQSPAKSGPLFTQRLPMDSSVLSPDSLASSRIQIFIQSTQTDSVSKDVLRTLVPKMSQLNFDSSAQRTFVLRIGPDSLNADSVKAGFRKALEALGYYNGVSIRSQLMPPPLTSYKRTDESTGSATRTSLSFAFDNDRGNHSFNIFSDTMHLESVRVSPMMRYGASLFNVRGVVIKEIAPQILFSVILTLVITAAFLIMYRSMRTQQRLMEIKNDFIRNVTHELKTPVATVSVALEALKNFHALDKPELTKEYLDIAQNELNRLTLMTDKILKTSVFEHGKVDVNVETFNLDTIITQVLASMKLLFEKRGAHVTYEKEGHDFEMQGGVIHITNVIYNLIDNALKYSPVNPVINVLLRNSPDKLTLSVKDSGIGIDENYHQKVFEKFFRVPKGDVHDTKGYGLGLSYVSSVVKSHRGTISLNSAINEGSTFVLSFPKKFS